MSKYCRRCIQQIITGYGDYCEACRLHEKKDLPKRISKCKKDDCIEDCRNFFLAGSESGVRMAKADAINKTVDRFKDFMIQAIVFGNHK